MTYQPRKNTGLFGLRLCTARGAHAFTGRAHNRRTDAPHIHWPRLSPGQCLHASYSQDAFRTFTTHTRTTHTRTTHSPGQCSYAWTSPDACGQQWNSALLRSCQQTPRRNTSCKKRSVTNDQNLIEATEGVRPHQIAGTWSEMARTKSERLGLGQYICLELAKEWPEPEPIRGVNPVRLEEDRVRWKVTNAKQ